MKVENGIHPLKRFYLFYHDGFKQMKLGKILWKIIFIKIFIMFFIIKPFFYPTAKFKNSSEKEKILKIESDFLGPLNK